MGSSFLASFLQKLRFVGKLTAVIATLLIMVGTQSVNALDNDQSDVMGLGILYFNTQYCTSDGTSSTTSSVTLVGKDNIEKAMNFFVSHKLTSMQAAAIIGNMMQESGLRPNAVNPTSGAYGIAQWLGGRLNNLKNKEGANYKTLGGQLDFLWYEVTQGSEVPFHALDAVKSASSLADAVTQWELKFERAGTAEANIPNRIRFANAALKLYGTGTSGSAGGTTDTGSASDTTSTSSGGCDSTLTSIDCSSNATSSDSGAQSPSSTTGAVRAKVVCIAEHELALYNNKTMKAGTDFHKYSEGRNENWCADFMSWVYNQAGYPLANPWNVPAVVTVQSIGQKGGKFQYHDAGSYSPKPGDMIIHLSGESHVNMVDKVQNGKMTELGGNQHGGGGYPNNLVTSYTISGSKDNIFTSDGITGYVSPTQ